MDMASFESVRRCARDLCERTSRLDILVNNAGVAMMSKPILTEDGQEMVLQVNHFSSFLLTNLLSGLLSRTANSRCVLKVSHLYSYTTISELS